jgi:hypothetical protein
MNDIIIDLHEDELPAWESLGIPDHWSTITGSTQGTQWCEILIHPEWREQFLVWVRLHHWHPDYFAQYYG